jgi:hypothetical protein
MSEWCNDNTVTIKNLVLQLPSTRQRNSLHPLPGTGPSVF